MNKKYPKGGFLARYVRRGTSYERAKDVVQEKNRANEKQKAPPK